MEFRRLGRTDISVSVIGFGGIPVGSLSGEEAKKVITHAVNRGINFFDTAPNYGASESNIGQALRDLREECIIATKTEEKTRADIASKGIDTSLKKLRTWYIDLIQLHGIDSLNHITNDDSTFYLVFLKMPDEVPLYCVTDGTKCLLSFLDIILSDDRGATINGSFKFRNSSPFPRHYQTGTRR